MMREAKNNSDEEQKKTEISIMEFGIKLIVLLNISQKGLCQVCNTTFVAPSNKVTSITTPGYNGGTGSYASNLDCYWILDSGKDDLRILMFITYDISCPNDKFYIHDGINGSSAKLADGQCGKAIATHYSTSQRYAYIRMTSDATLERAGLLVEYVAAKDYSGNSCGNSKQTLTATEAFQYLSSPNFPNQYPSDSNCRWAIHNVFGTIEIEVILSDIEADAPAACNYGYYEIYDGEYVCEHNTIRKVCQEFQNKPIYSYSSNGTSIVVKFVSDSSVNRRGFLLRYRVEKSPKITSIATTRIDTTNITTSDSTTTERNATTNKQSGTTTTSVPCTIYINTTTAEDIKLNFDLLLGFIGGSLFLVCQTIVIVVCIVTKAKPPSGKIITPVQPFRPYESVEKKSIRVRKTSTNQKPMFTQSGVCHKSPPW